MSKRRRGHGGRLRALLSYSIFGVGSGCGIEKPYSYRTTPDALSCLKDVEDDLVDDAALPPMVEMGNDRSSDGQCPRSCGCQRRLIAVAFADRDACINLVDCLVY